MLLVEVFILLFVVSVRGVFLLVLLGCGIFKYIFEFFGGVVMIIFLILFVDNFFVDVKVLGILRDDREFRLIFFKFLFKGFNSVLFERFFVFLLKYFVIVWSGLVLFWLLFILDVFEEILDGFLCSDLVVGLRCRKLCIN